MLPWVRYDKVTFWLDAFVDSARDALIDIDTRESRKVQDYGLELIIHILTTGIERTDVFIAEEEDGTAWLLRPPDHCESNQV